MKAVEVIMEHGVPEDRIIFINLVRALSTISTFIPLTIHRLLVPMKIAAPEGLNNFCSRFPQTRVVSLVKDISNIYKLSLI